MNTWPMTVTKMRFIGRDSQREKIVWIDVVIVEEYLGEISEGMAV